MDCVGFKDAANVNMHASVWLNEHSRSVELREIDHETHTSSRQKFSLYSCDAHQSLSHTFMLSSRVPGELHEVRPLIQVLFLLSLCQPSGQPSLKMLSPDPSPQNLPSSSALSPAHCLDSFQTLCPISLAKLPAIFRSKDAARSLDLSLPLSLTCDDGVRSRKGS